MKIPFYIWVVTFWTWNRLLFPFFAWFSFYSQAVWCNAKQNRGTPKTMMKILSLLISSLWKKKIAWALNKNLSLLRNLDLWVILIISNPWKNKSKTQSELMKTISMKKDRPFLNLISPIWKEFSITIATGPNKKQNKILISSSNIDLHKNLPISGLAALILEFLLIRSLDFRLENFLFWEMLLILFLLLISALWPWFSMQLKFWKWLISWLQGTTVVEESKLQ